jgi:hypothetical protein
MNVLARLALRLLTGIGTVFIAACYGVPHEVRAAKVVDAQTKSGIARILVSCLASDGSVYDEETTGANGEVAIRAHCHDYRAEDVDGTANGSYAAKTVPDPGDVLLVIELDPVP